MTEATIHPIPSETTVHEDVSTLAQDFKRYFHRNGDAFLMLTLTTVGIMMNRVILRRELRRLSFNVEIFPDDAWGDYGNSHFDED